MGQTLSEPVVEKVRLSPRPPGSVASRNISAPSLVETARQRGISQCLIVAASVVLLEQKPYPAYFYHENPHQKPCVSAGAFAFLACSDQDYNSIINTLTSLLRGPTFMASPVLTSSSSSLTSPLPADLRQRRG